MTETSPKEGFTTREVMIDGHLAVVTVNYALKDLKGKAWCPWHLTISILLEGGLPNSDEAKALEKIEDDLHLLLRRVCEFDYIGRITLNGLRELHFYLDSPDDAHYALTAAIENGTSRELEHKLEYDEEWLEVEHLFGYS